MLTHEPETTVETGSVVVQPSISALQNPNFLRLWSGQLFSQVADKVFLILMIALTSSRFQDRGESISAWVSAIMVASTIPAILFGAVAGVYVDRWAKQAVLIISNLLRGSLVLSIPFLLWMTRDYPEIHGIPMGFLVLLSITFGVSTLTQFFAPAEQAILPLVVDNSELLSANSLCTSTMMGSVIMGFAIGEPMLVLADHLARQWWGGADYGSALAVGGAYLLSAVSLLTVRPSVEAHLNDEEPPRVWDDLKVGFHYLGRTPLVRAAMTQLISLYAIFAALAVLAVRLAEVIPGMKASQFGFLLAAAGVGMGVGAFVVGHTGQQLSRSRWSLWGSVGVSIALGLLAWTSHSLLLSVILISVVGFTGALVGVPMQTVIQEETPSELRGKVFGLVNNLTNIALSLPLVLAGVAETLFGLTPVILSLGVIMAVTGLFTHRMVKQAVLGEES